MTSSHVNSKYRILVADDEPLVRRSLSELLSLSGYSVHTASNGREALELLKSSPVTDIVIADIKMPELDGIQLLKHIKRQHIDSQVILVTGYGSIENAIEAMKEGAYDYITKPIVDGEIKILIDRLVAARKLKEENIRLKEQISAQQRDHFHGIVGKNEQMQKIYTLIEAVCDSRATVLIHGESGTGKRLIAHALHKCSPQFIDKPFVEVSCGALTETLLESELFGHVKGAFTGAVKDKVGRFELANGGTIFLDEIDAFSPALQVKLLRVLQEGEFERVGESKPMKVDARVIVATNQKLEELITHGKFRKDLYYRLNIICIEIPPLKERKDDIPLLVENFIKKHAGSIHKKIQGISDDTLTILAGYNWPGNIRELENVIERATILCKTPIIMPKDLPDSISKVSVKTAVKEGDNGSLLRLKDALQSPEKDLILKALESVKWNRNEAAKTLGINRTTLYKKMQKFGFLNNTLDARKH